MSTAGKQQQLDRSPSPSSTSCLPLLLRSSSKPRCCISSRSRSDQCSHMSTCQLHMCSGNVPLSCLMDVGQKGAHIHYGSSLPFVFLERHGGFGVAVGDGFKAIHGNSDTPSSSPSESGHDATTTLATTDRTVLDFDLTAVSQAGNLPTRFSAQVKAGGKRKLCERHNVWLRIDVECKTVDGFSRQSTEVEYSAPPQHEQLELELDGCLSLKLSTHVIYSKSVLPFALRRSCYAMWTHTVINGTRSKSPCDLVCNNSIKEVPLYCLSTNSQSVVQPTGTPDNRLDDNLNFANIDEYSSSNAAPKPDTAAQLFDDIHLDIDPRHPRAAYVVDIFKLRRLGVRFDHLVSHLKLEGSHWAADASNCSRQTKRLLAVDFKVLVNRRTAFTRRLTYNMQGSETASTVSDVDDFIANIWQVKSPRQLTLQAALVESESSECLRAMRVVFQAPKLQPNSSPPKFGRGCQDHCIEHRESGDSSVYLSCYVGKRGNKRHQKPKLGFSCSGTITGKNNSFISVSTNGAKGRIGVDRAGPWTPKHQEVRLTHPEQPLNSTVYHHSLGTYPDSTVIVRLSEFRRAGLIFNTFSAVIGLDVASGCERRHFGSVTFEVWLDNKLVDRRDANHDIDTVEINIDVSKALQMKLVTHNGGIHTNYANCRPSVWANPRLRQLSWSF